MELAPADGGPDASHLVLQLRYLVFEVADVLAGVCVVQLALDLSFFFLLVEKMSLEEDN